MGTHATQFPSVVVVVPLGLDFRHDEVGSSFLRTLQSASLNYFQVEKTNCT
jgi:hypothetical protein